MVLKWLKKLMYMDANYNQIDVNLDNTNDLNVVEVSSNIEKNKDILLKSFRNTSDLVTYNFQNGSGSNVLIVYIDGLVSKDVIDRDIIKPIVNEFDGKDFKKAVHVVNIKEAKTMQEVISYIVGGNTAIFIDGFNLSFIADNRGWKMRSVEAPDAEAVIRGPREGFVESIKTNVSMLRRKIKNNNLIIERMIIGRQTRTEVSIAYVDGIVNKDILDEVRKRLNKIDTDVILETGYIEQFIEDSHISPLSTIGNTQKPDIVAAKILEGRVAIFCDGTPHVLTVPQLFIENLQTSEDYYIRPFAASILREIRMTALFNSILLPGLYVAFQTFHQEMIPTVLLITMSGAREGIPLPTFAEAFIMTLAFELLRESGTRLPRPVGSAITIVGALILGEAAVNAGIVSAAMVIIIAVTAVSSFILPSLTEAMTIYRFLFIALGGTMGLYGIVCGIVVMVVQAISLKPFGIPYFSPIAPFSKSGIKDYIIRFPLWAMNKRPESIVKENKKRWGK